MSASPELPDEETRARLTSLLRSRREGKLGAVPFEEITSDRRTPVPVAADEVLVAVGDASRRRVQDLLGELLPDREQRTMLDGGLIRVRLPRDPGRKLGTVLARLRERGVEAHPNAMMPLGSGALSIVWKATSTPRGAAAPAEATVSTAAAGAAAAGAVRIAAIDTGVNTEDRTDGWLAGLQTAANRDPLDELPEPPDGYLDLAAGHGTFVAGVLRQVDPVAALDVVRRADSDGLITDADVADAVVAAVRAGADIVNLSLGVETVDDQPPPAFTRALKILDRELAGTGREVLIVAAAGNSGSTRPVWPAACADDRVVAVAALTAAGAGAPWSSRGPWVTCSVLGEDVLSTYVSGVENPAVDPAGHETFGPDAWATWSGTSFAAPQVAARIAGIARAEGSGVRAALDRLLKEATGHDPDYGALLSSVL